MGLFDELVAISHECDYPIEVRSKPVVTSSSLGTVNNSSAEIDSLVSQRLHEHQGIYTLDESLLARLKPDLILTQELCDVCAVSYQQVEEAVRMLPGEQTLLSLEPTTLSGIMATIRAVGGATGRGQAADLLVADLESQLGQPQTATPGTIPRPRVACLEWLNPPFSAGHWVPEMVGIAGGHDALARAGDQSRRLAWADVLASEPDVIVLMPCGFDVERTCQEYARESWSEAWLALAAVRAGRVFATDANAYFSRPGPRVVRGAEILREILAASESGALEGSGWRRLPERAR